MGTAFRLVAQFLLIPLIKEAVVYFLKRQQERLELKKLREENKKREEAHAKASPDTAHTEFERLP